MKIEIILKEKKSIKLKSFYTFFPRVIGENVKSHIHFLFQIDCYRTVEEIRHCHWVCYMVLKKLIYQIFLFRHACNLYSIGHTRMIFKKCKFQP